MEKLFKRTLYGILLVVMLLSSITVNAAGIDEIKVKIDDVEVVFDQQPIIKDNRTLVPMRGIFETMGATVKWDNSTRTVEGIKNDIVVIMTIDDKVIQINDKSIVLDVAPIIVNSRTLVPLRAVAEAFDSEVEWDGVTRTVIINTNEMGNINTEDSKYKLDEVDNINIEDTTIEEDESNQVNYIDVNDIRVSIGESLSSVNSKLGTQSDINLTEYYFDWYIYNVDDYVDFIMVGIHDYEVVALYTNAKGFKTEYVSFGEKEPEEYNKRVNVFVDTATTENIVYAVLITAEGIKVERKNTEEYYQSVAKTVFYITNGFRVANEKEPLLANKQANTTAYKHSKDMAENNYFSHTGLDGSSPKIRYERVTGTSEFIGVGENIYQNGANFADAIGIVHSFIRSHGHRGNMLKGWTYLGTGVYKAEEPTYYGAYTTQLFLTAGEGKNAGDIDLGNDSGEDLPLNSTTSGSAI